MLKIIVEDSKNGGTNFHSETNDTNTFEVINAIMGLFEMILKFDENYKNYRQIYKELIKLKKSVNIEEEMKNNGNKK